jgi:hypothetical protein
MREHHASIQDILVRGVAVVGLAGIALIHLLDSISKFHETPYMGWMYVGLMAGSLVAAGLLIRVGSRLGWAASGVLAASAIVGYVLSRTTGLPNATGDIGNWTEPLGLASLFVEGCVVALSVWGASLPKEKAHVLHLVTARESEEMAA